MVTVVAVYAMTGADIRPVVGEPLEQAISQTRMRSSVAAGPGEANDGSSAQVAGPNSAERAPEMPGGSRSGGTGQVATGHVGTGEEAPGAAEHPARPAIIKAAATIGANACARREGRLLQSCFTDIASPLDLCPPTLTGPVQFHTASLLVCSSPRSKASRLAVTDRHNAARVGDLDRRTNPWADVHADRAALPRRARVCAPGPLAAAVALLRGIRRQRKTLTRSTGQAPLDCRSELGFGAVSIGRWSVAQRFRPGLTAEQKRDMWSRWKAGQSLSEIGRALGIDHLAPGVGRRHATPSGRVKEVLNECERSGCGARFGSVARVATSCPDQSRSRSRASGVPGPATPVSLLHRRRVWPPELGGRQMDRGPGDHSDALQHMAGTFPSGRRGRPGLPAFFVQGQSRSRDRYVLWLPFPPSACAWPAVYRTASATEEGLGNCGGNFFDPPAEVRLQVGEELDLHMTTYAPAGSTAPVPEYLLPSSPDDRVLRLDTVSDAGATGAYRAVAPGVVTLSTNGWCFHLATNTEVTGTCPVVRVTVIAEPAELSSIGRWTPAPYGPTGACRGRPPTDWRVGRDPQPWRACDGR